MKFLATGLRSTTWSSDRVPTFVQPGGHLIYLPLPVPSLKRENGIIPCMPPCLGFGLMVHNSIVGPLKSALISMC